MPQRLRNPLTGTGWKCNHFGVKAICYPMPLFIIWAKMSDRRSAMVRHSSKQSKARDASRASFYLLNQSSISQHSVRESICTKARVSDTKPRSVAERGNVLIQRALAASSTVLYHPTRQRLQIRWCLSDHHPRMRE